jgi:tetratricopeptide (TPR) repeat protein
MRDRGWTLMLMGRPESLQEAEELFSQSWSLRDHVPLDSQLELAIERAILSLHQRQSDTAHSRLQKARTLLQQVDEEPRHRYQLIRIHYYEAEAWYYREDYDQSRTLYSEVLEQARLIQWQQVEVYTLNWLADIALKQGHLSQAENLLIQSLPLAEQHQDKRSIAFHHRSWALLEHLRGKLPQCQHWSREAKRYFEDLGMDAEAKEMQVWSEMGLALNASLGHEQ